MNFKKIYAETLKYARKCSEKPKNADLSKNVKYVAVSMSRFSRDSGY